jgi:hypothetical protein
MSLENCEEREECLMIVIWNPVFLKHKKSVRESQELSNEMKRRDSQNNRPP